MAKESHPKGWFSRAERRAKYLKINQKIFIILAIITGYIFVLELIYTYKNEEDTPSKEH